MSEEVDMLQIRHLNYWLVFCVALATTATSCTKHTKVIPIVELRQMPTFKAKVERIEVNDFSQLDPKTGMMAVADLKTEDGRRVAIGGIKATAEMTAFIQSFREGQMYTFPEVLLEYEKSHGLQLQ